MIICNGFPKSGTNLLMRIVALMGISGYSGMITQNIPDKDKIHYNILNHVSGREYTKTKTDWDTFDKIPNTQHVHAHLHPTIPHQHLLDGHKMIVIMRHPKNSIISYCRWRIDTPEQQQHWQSPSKRFKTLQANIEKTRVEKDVMLSFPEHYSGFYSGWMQHNSRNVLLVQFEELDQPNILEQIAGHINGSLDFDKSKLFGIENTKDIGVATRTTFSGNHSDWSSVWTAELEQIWQEYGGLDCEQRLGYS